MKVIEYLDLSTILSKDNHPHSLIKPLYVVHR